MFKGIEQRPVSERFSRMVLPRGDWFDSTSIQSFLIQLIPQFQQLGFDLTGGDELIDICQAESLSEYVTPAEPSRGISGLKTEYPQHAGMVMLGRWASIEDRRLRLAALVMLCVDDWRERLAGPDVSPDQVEVFRRRLAEVWRMLRLASVDVFDLIPPIRLELEDFHDQLESALEELDPRAEDRWGQDIDYLRLLLRFINYYLGGGALCTRSRRSNGQDRTEYEIRSVTLSPVDSESEVQGESSGDQTLVTRQSMSQLRRSDHFQEGNASEEIEDGPRLIKSDKPISSARGGSPVQAAVRLKKRQIHQSRCSQILPRRWSALNDFELRILGDALQPENDDIDTASTVALWLVLLTGRPLDNVLSVRVVRRAEQVPENVSPDKVYLVADAGEWVVGVLRPENRRKTRTEWKDVLEQHEDRIFLPFPTPIWNQISRLVGPASQRAKKQSVRLFSQNECSGIRENASHLVSQLNRRNKIRLTLSRIEYQLTEALHRVSCDLVEANLLTGRQPPFGASAALYYHHQDRQSLVDHYMEVTDYWSRLIFPQQISHTGQQKMLIDGRVGSDLVLRTEVVKRLFVALREQVDYDRKLLGTLDGLRTFHNSLTDHAMMMTLWLSGYRVVQDPIAQATDFNACRRLLVVADKTGDGYGHSRIVPVCSVLFDQLAAYRSHVEWLRNRLALVGRNCQGTVFFYLDDNLHEVQVRPSSMRDFLEWAYVLPLNLNRHWLRGALREEGVPGPHVDRFMGHWGMGQEPWGRYSGVDPHDFRRTLEVALNSLAEALGLAAVGGVA